MKYESYEYVFRELSSDRFIRFSGMGFVGLTSLSLMLVACGGGGSSGSGEESDDNPVALRDYKTVKQDNKLILSFNNEVKIDKDKIIVGDGTKLSIDGSRIIVELSDAKDNLKIKFEKGAIRNSNGQDITLGTLSFDTKFPTLNEKEPILLQDKTITVNFSEAIKDKNDDRIIVFKGEERLTLEADYTLVLQDDKLLITLESSSLVEGVSYKVRILKGGVVDDADNEILAVETSEVVAPDVTLPTLAEQNSIFIGGRVITVSFSEAIKSKSDDRIIVFKGEERLTLEADYSLALRGDKLLITLESSSLVEGVSYKVRILEGGLVDNSDNEILVVETSEVVAPDVTLPTLAEQNSIFIGGRVITVSFSEAIKSKSDDRIIVFKGEERLTLEADYSLALQGDKLLVTLKESSLVEGVSYKIRILEGGLVDNSDNEILVVETSAVIAPDVTPPTLAEQDSILLEDKTITVSFSEAIKAKSDDRIIVFKGEEELKLETDYSLALQGDKLLVTLKESSLVEGVSYKVRILEGGLVDNSDNEILVVETSEVVAPDVTLPTLAEQNSILLEDNTITVNFSETIKAKIDGKISVFKGSDRLTLGTDYNLALQDYKLLITLQESSLVEGAVYKVRILGGGVVDNADNEILVIETSEVVAPDVTPPTLAEQNSILIKGNIITVSFSEAIKSKSDDRIIVFKGEEELTLGSDYTLALQDYKLLITLKEGSLVEGAVYKIRISEGGVVDHADNEILAVDKLEVIAPDVTPPTLAEQDSILIKGNIITVSFSEAIKAKRDGKISVLKGSDRLTLGSDYSLDLRGGKLLINLKEGFLVEGASYKVGILEGGVVDHADNEILEVDTSG